MFSHAHSQTPSDLRETLSNDHERLDQLFDAVLEAFEANDRDDARETWTRFESGLRRHIEFETRHILPRFHQRFPDEAAALEHEHQRLLAQLGELSVGVDLHLTRADVVSELVRTLRSHAERENKLMYVWAQSDDGSDAAGRASMFTALRDLITAAQAGRS